jgi:hypothetical protein
MGSNMIQVASSSPSTSFVSPESFTEKSIVSLRLVFFTDSVLAYFIPFLLDMGLKSGEKFEKNFMRLLSLLDSFSFSFFSPSKRKTCWVIVAVEETVPGTENYFQLLYD